MGEPQGFALACGLPGPRARFDRALEKGAGLEGYVGLCVCGAGSLIPSRVAESRQNASAQRLNRGSPGPRSLAEGRAGVLGPLARAWMLCRACRVYEECVRDTRRRGRFILPSAGWRTKQSAERSEIATPRLVGARNDAGHASCPEEGQEQRFSG